MKIASNLISRLLFAFERRKLTLIALCALAFGGVLAISAKAFACPFCSALASSLREDLKQTDHVVVATCTELAEPDAEFPVYSFKVTSIIRRSVAGPQESKPPSLINSVIEAYSQKTYRLGDTVLLFGVGEIGNAVWGPSEPLSLRAQQYVKKVVELHNKTANSKRNDTRLSTTSDWLTLYWENLESKEAWVRRDAYNALATVSIKELRPWAEKADPADVRARISMRSTSQAHRRFYWTVLGLCGSESDIEFVKEAIARQLAFRKLHPMAVDTVGLDSAISCLLLLGGVDSLKQVEQQFFTDEDRHSSERFAAMTALRVHSEEFHVLEKSEISSALSLLLDHPDLADQIIPDLARLEDWTHVARLENLFRNAEKERQFLRTPIINYFRVCPRPEAKIALENCAEIDPSAYRRAKLIFPFLRNENSDPR